MSLYEFRQEEGKAKRLRQYVEGISNEDQKGKAWDHIRKNKSRK